MNLISKEKGREFRKVAYFAVVVADILDKLLWRIRPYEKTPGSTDDFIERSMQAISGGFETHGANKDFERILDKLGDIVEEGKDLIDPTIPPKPLIGIVGEIYLRTHVQSNQNLIRVLETYGAEVVNASIAEWVNFTTYGQLREARKSLRLNLKQFRFRKVKEALKKIVTFGGELCYQQVRQNQVCKKVKPLIDLESDHRVGHLEKIVVDNDLFSFDVGTEACLSIPGIMEYVNGGYNGVVNVYPFTCMPSTATSAVVKPFMNQMRVPYLDTPYDGSYQPGREAAIRTFMYQAQQHQKRNGRRGLRN